LVGSCKETTAIWKPWCCHGATWPCDPAVPQPAMVCCCAARPTCL
jgi:hypothetical protein